MTETVRDAEYFIDKFISVYTDNLNTKIAEINTAKGDSLLDSVDSNAYYYLTFGQKVPAYEPAVVFGVGVELGGNIRAGANETLILAATMVISSKGEASSLNVMRRIQRYRRALIEVITDNYEKFPSMEFDVVPEIGFTEASRFYYALGIVAKTTYPT